MVTGQGPVTITDVARLAGAGVSPGTASKARNGRRGISARTAMRVRHAAERLGYQPNALARGLLSGRSFTVGADHQVGRAAGERLLAAVNGQQASGLQLMPCRW